MTTNDPSKVFDYKMLRLLMGLIALFLPLLVWLRASTPLPSISASYYTESRDIFVGLLFIISAFLWAYNGHTIWEARLSKIAALDAAFVAYFPTACASCDADLTSGIHYASAIGLFSILAYFCLGPFRKNTKGKPGKKGLRSKIYLACGSLMVASMLVMGLSKFVFHIGGDVIFWGETVALVAFGIAWIVAGKWLPFLVHSDEALTFRPKVS